MLSAAVQHRDCATAACSVSASASWLQMHSAAQNSMLRAQDSVPAKHREEMAPAVQPTPVRALAFSQSAPTPYRGPATKPARMPPQNSVPQQPHSSPISAEGVAYMRQTECCRQRIAHRQLLLFSLHADCAIAEAACY